MVQTKPTVKPQELRIGNWVSVNGKAVLINSVDDTGINADVEYGVYGSIYYDGRFDHGFFLWNALISPIPITSELLGKCGFEKEVGVDDLECWNCEGVKLWFASGFYHINSELLIHLDYLHQLQNFYFVVTGGEELTVNL